MPRISEFYGIVISMYWSDHAPPHFHARYGEFDASVEIRSGEVLSGFLPPREARLVRQWTLLRRDELLIDWALASTNQAPNPIEPLA